jgi:hypothetical protein
VSNEAILSLLSSAADASPAGVVDPLHQLHSVRLQLMLVSHDEGRDPDWGLLERFVCCSFLRLLECSCDALTLLHSFSFQALASSPSASAAAAGDAGQRELPLLNI